MTLAAGGLGFFYYNHKRPHVSANGRKKKTLQEERQDTSFPEHDFPLSSATHVPALATPCCWWWGTLVAAIASTVHVAGTLR